MAKLDAMHMHCHRSFHSTNLSFFTIPLLAYILGLQSIFVTAFPLANSFGENLEEFQRSSLRIETYNSSGPILKRETISSDFDSKDYRFQFPR